MPRVRSPTPTLSAASLLRLLRVASPALPVGGFSYSEGLEAAVESGRVNGEAAARDWLLDQMRLVQSRAEWPLLASAFKAWQRDDTDTLQALNTWAWTTRETAESRQQTAQMGRSLTEWLRQRQPGDARVDRLAAMAPAPCWPLACALAAAQSGAPLRESLLALGFGWCENMVQAALKTVPLGQAAGQRLLDALADALPAAVDDALRRSAAGSGAQGRQSFAPMMAVLSARHEAQYSRLFRS